MVRRVLVAVLWLMGVASCAWAQSSQSRESIGPSISQLRESAPTDPGERITYKQVVYRFLEELRESPLSADVGFALGPSLQLGQMEWEDGNYPAGLLLFQQTVRYIEELQANPDAARRWPEVSYLEEAEVMLAECLYRLGRWDEAAGVYARVIERLQKSQPTKRLTLSRALHGAGALAADQGDWPLARQRIRASVDLTLALPGIPSDAVAERLKALIQLAAADPGAPESRDIVTLALESARRSDLERDLPVGYLDLVYAALAYYVGIGDLQIARQVQEAVSAPSQTTAAVAAAPPGLRLALELRQLELLAQLGDEASFHTQWETIRSRAIALPSDQQDVFAEQARQMAWASLDATLAGLGQEGDRAFRAREVTELSASLLIPLLGAEHPRSRQVQLQAGMWQMFTLDTPSARSSFESLLQHDVGTAEDARLRAFATLMLGWVHALQGHDDAAVILGKDALNGFREQKAVGAAAQCGLACADVSRLALTGESMAYRLLTDWLIRAGRLSEAQQLLVALREHELEESLRWGSASASGDGRAALTGLEMDRFRGFYRLREQQAALARERLQLQAQQATGRLDGAGRTRLRQIGRLEAEELKPAVSRFLQGLDSDMATDADKSVVQNNASVRSEATQIQRDIDQWARESPHAPVVGVQYLVGRDSLSILVTVPGLSPIARQLPVKRADLYTAVFTAQTLMRTPQSVPTLLKPALQELHALLLAPVEADLRRLGARTLLLSLDDRLRQLPFAALMGSDGRYVIEDYAIALYNEATARVLAPGGARDWRVAAMGTSKSVGGLPALVAVPTELAQVVRASRSGGQTFLDAQFNRAALDRALTRRTGAPFNVLHLASHFVLQPGDAGASTLFLGDGTSLSLAEIARRQLDFHGFDLVVYSACETGVAGGRTANGMEMESLSALTRRQGAASVLGTLWKVSDASVAQAMATFYDQSARGGATLAETLRQTQLAMLRGGLGTPASHQHPFHWAPFVLMGNWR